MSRSHPLLPGLLLSVAMVATATLLAESADPAEESAPDSSWTDRASDWWTEAEEDLTERWKEVEEFAREHWSESDADEMIERFQDRLEATRAEAARRMEKLRRAATREEIQRRYEEAREAGTTRAENAREWVREDMERIGAWEYHTEVLPGPSEAMAERLNALGRERWELVEVVPGEDGRLLGVFKKRPRSYLRHLPVQDLLQFLGGATVGM